MGDNRDYFDFEEKSESEENLDFNHFKNCPHCKKPIASNATFCLYCGEPVNHSGKSKWLVWAAIIILILFILWVL